MKKRLIFYYSLTVVLTIIASTTLVRADSGLELEVKYPNLSQTISPPQSAKGYLVDYIKYIFEVAIFLSGIVAFVAFLRGGFSYLTSTGNPSKMQDARDQILAGFLGLIIILGSFILLNTINPQLTEIKPPGITGVGRGIIVYSDENCGDGANALPGVLKPLPEGVIYERVEWTKALSSTSRAQNGTRKGMAIRSLYSFNSGEELVRIEFYQNKECQGQPISVFTPPNADKCYSGTDIADQGKIEDVQCIKLIWHIPGVWLFTEEDGNPESPTGPFTIIQMDAPSLPEKVAGKVKSIALVDDELKHQKYGVVLHEKSGPRYKVKGWAHPYFPKPQLSTTRYKTTNKNAHSATVFIVDENTPSKWVRLCEHDDCQPASVNEGGEVVSKPAERYYMWPGENRPPVGGNTTPLKEIEKVPPEYARGALLHEDADEWWKGGDKVAICESVSGINWIGRITQLTGKCYRGVSAIELEEGSSYILILWATGKTKPQWVEGARGNAPALIIDKTTRKLIDFGFNEQLGMFLVIKVKSSF
ncbi:hypothetical protein J7K92_02090 [bacterium]|nr:hypothetical protein [bacterium]